MQVQHKNHFLLGVLLVFALLSSAAQVQKEPSAPVAAFEVATIKASHAEGDRVDRTIKPLPAGNGYMARNFPVRLMIALMYKVPVRQVQGGPRWLDDEYFDIEAHAEGIHSKDELQTMFRALLADRFALRMHTVEREGKVFALRVNGGASKMQPNAKGPGMAIPVLPSGLGEYVGRGVSLPYLCWFLGQQMQDRERPVIDRTGLSGTWDFKLSFVPDSLSSGDPDHLPAELRDKPSLQGAVREQLGLRLVPEDGPVEYLEIDRVERPSVD